MPQCFTIKVLEAIWISVSLIGKYKRKRLKSLTNCANLNNISGAKSGLIPKAKSLLLWFLLNSYLKVDLLTEGKEDDMLAETWNYLFKRV